MLEILLLGGGGRFECVHHSTSSGGGGMAVLVRCDGVAVRGGVECGGT